LVIAGIVTLVALATVVASLGHAHLKPTGLSPVRNAVSQYGISPTRSDYRVATLAFAAAGVGLTVALSQVVDHREAAIIAFLCVFAVARALISWFPMDAPGAERTSTGALHGLLAIAAFGSATVAAFRLGTALSDQHTWHGLAAVSTALAWLMLAFLLGMVSRRVVPSIGRWFGAIERGFYVAAIAWFAVFAIAATVH